MEHQMKEAGSEPMSQLLKSWDGLALHNTASFQGTLHVIKHHWSIKVLVHVCQCPEGEKLHSRVCVLTWLNSTSSSLSLICFIISFAAPPPPSSHPSVSPTQHFWERLREKERLKRARQWFTHWKRDRVRVEEGQRRRDQSSRSIWNGFLWYDVMTTLAFIYVTVPFTPVPQALTGLDVIILLQPDRKTDRNTFPADCLVDGPKQEDFQQIILMLACLGPANLKQSLWYTIYSMKLWHRNP